VQYTFTHKQYIEQHNIHKQYTDCNKSTNILSVWSLSRATIPTVTLNNAVSTTAVVLHTVINNRIVNGDESAQIRRDACIVSRSSHPPSFVTLITCCQETRDGKCKRDVNK